MKLKSYCSACSSTAKKVETKDLNEKADKIEKCQDVTDRVK